MVKTFDDVPGVANLLKIGSIPYEIDDWYTYHSSFLTSPTFITLSPSLSSDQSTLLPLAFLSSLLSLFSKKLSLYVTLVPSTFHLFCVVFLVSLSLLRGVFDHNFFKDLFLQTAAFTN